MDVTVSAADFTATLTTCTLTAAQAEAILDNAIDLLILYGDDLFINHLTGTAGTKTLSCTDKTRAAIYLVARAIYQSNQREIAGEEAAAITINMLSNTTVLQAVKDAAARLKEENFDWTDAII